MVPIGNPLQSFGITSSDGVIGGNFASGAGAIIGVGGSFASQQVTTAHFGTFWYIKPPSRAHLCIALPCCPSLQSCSALLVPILVPTKG